MAACEQASAVAERAAKARNGIVDRVRAQAKPQTCASYSALAAKQVPCRQPCPAGSSQCMRASKTIDACNAQQMCLSSQGKPGVCSHGSQSSSCFTAPIVQSCTSLQPRRVEPVHVPNGWPCSFCGNGNLMSTQVCQKCGKPKVDVTAKPVQEGKVRRASSAGCACATWFAHNLTRAAACTCFAHETCRSTIEQVVLELCARCGEVGHS